MPRTFPSQIVGFLVHHFGDKSSIPTVHVDKVGIIAAFIELYDSMPPELIRLSTAEYSQLIAAVGQIRVALDQWRQTRQADSFIGVPEAFRAAWPMMKKLSDSIPAATHDLGFISDGLLQEMIALDVSAVTTDLQSGEWKSATIIAGSCCEALLLYGLQTVDRRTARTIATAVSAIAWPARRPDPLDPTLWDLFAYTEVAHKIGLISDDTKAELGPTRQYRNLIHPAKTVRQNVRCDRGTAYVAIGALEHVISDLRKNLKASR